MFWYVISMIGEFKPKMYDDDLIVTDDRGTAEVAIRLLGLPVRCVAK